MWGRHGTRVRLEMGGRSSGSEFGGNAPGCNEHLFTERRTTPTPVARYLVRGDIDVETAARLRADLDTLSTRWCRTCTSIHSSPTVAHSRSSTLPACRRYSNFARRSQTKAADCASRT